MRTVVVLPKDRGATFHQGLYLDYANSSLIPNRTFVDGDGNLLFETNSYGLRGPEIEPGRRFAVVWGDSVVFGLASRGWPEQINDYSKDCLFLNGGIEGLPHVGVLRRALHFNRERTADLNIILLGWHRYPDNRSVREDLENALAEIPNVVLVTQPSSLNAAHIEEDLSPYFDSSPQTYYAFWNHEPYSVAAQKAWFAYICERNEIVRSVARETGTPLLDLFAILESSRLPDFRQYFFDVGHLRYSAYPQIAQIVYEAVRPLLDARATAP